MKRLVLALCHQIPFRFPFSYVSHRLTLKKIVSGGQTGVDRAGLDAAIEANIDHGGWCPRYRLAEDGKVPKKYKLSESLSKEYKVRTELNVQDSDGTLILYKDKMTRGTKLTFGLTKKLDKPVLALDVANELSAESVLEWIENESIEVLNIAGPRESTNPGIHETAITFLRTVFALSVN